MGRAYSGDLRIRVIEAADTLGSARRAAAVFKVSASTAIKWVQAYRRDKQTSAKARGHRREILEPHTAWLLAKVKSDSDHNLLELQMALEIECGVRVCVSTIWRFLDKRGYSFKKNSVRHRAAS